MQKNKIGMYCICCNINIKFMLTMIVLHCYQAYTALSFQYMILSQAQSISAFTNYALLHNISQEKQLSNFH